MTAIERAWEAVDARDPTALHQCVDAMALAREVLLEEEASAGAAAELGYATSSSRTNTARTKV